MGQLTRRALLLASLIVIPFAASSAALSDHPGPSTWTWQNGNPANKVIRIDFARGDVRIVRRPGPVTIRVTRHAIRGYATDAAIVVTEDATSFNITDHYPPPSGRVSRECLPLADARGDFWENIIRLETEVRLPTATPVYVTVIDGRVLGR